MNYLTVPGLLSFVTFAYKVHFEKICSLYLQSPLFPASLTPTDFYSNVFTVCPLVLMCTPIKRIALLCVHVFYIYINYIPLYILLSFLHLKISS